MRITTNMMMRGYEANLGSALLNYDKTRTQASTGRRFDQSYVDPFSATKAVTLEHRYARNADYADAVDKAIKWQTVQESSVMEINDIISEVEKRYSMEALNDTNAGDREIYAETIRTLQESVVYALNAQYGDTYVLAGSDGKTNPFEIDESGTVTYRGLDLEDPANFATFEELSKETAYVDLGFGLLLDDATGEVVANTAFNTSLPGINIVGFGESDEGNNKNLIVLLGEMADTLDEEPFDRDYYEELWTELSDNATMVRNNIAEIGTRSQLLDRTKENIEDDRINIITQFDSTVNIDEAEAITNMSYADYVYNVSLKIGTNILKPSLLDFLT